MSKSKKPASSSKKTKRPDGAQKRSGDFSRSRTAEAVTTKATKVDIKPAKGRPMLTWVGKKPLRYAIAMAATGLLALTIQFIMAPTHTIGGINYADVWHTTFTIIGVTLIFAGIATEVYTEAVSIRREALAKAIK